jgi:hypothetical protein
MDNRTQSIIKGLGTQALLGKRNNAEIRIKSLTASLAEAGLFLGRH